MLNATLATHTHTHTQCNVTILLYHLLKTTTIIKAKEAFSRLALCGCQRGEEQILYRALYTLTVSGPLTVNHVRQIRCIRQYFELRIEYTLDILNFELN